MISKELEFALIAGKRALILAADEAGPDSIAGDKCRRAATEIANHIDSLSTPPSAAQVKHDCKPSEGAVSDELLGRLFVAMCASCSCLTKTPDPKYHKLDCLFRILNDAHDRLVSNLATIARQAGEIKHLELQLEHPRKEDQDFIAELQARIRSLEAELEAARKSV